MKKIFVFLLSTICCASLFAVDNSSAIVYAADSLSAELKVTSSYFDGEEHFFTFVIPQNRAIKITRINNNYFLASSDKVLSLWVNETEDIIRPNEKFNLGVFVDTIVNAYTFTFVIDNITTPYSYQPRDPAITLRFVVIDEHHPTSESLLFNGDVEVVSGALTTSGHQNFMGTKVTAILGDDYDEYTCFGSARGGMIRGSNEGYLILSGNPNGYGNRNVYINRYTSNGDVIMTAGSGQVGIGVDAPKEKLHVNGAIRGGGVNGAVTLRGDSGYVTIGASRHALDFITDKESFLFHQPIYSKTGIYNVLNNNLYFNTNGVTRLSILQSNGNVGIGTTTPEYTLDVAGTIRSEEIIVETDGADFVFEDNYNLRPLSEVESFVQEYKHLPEIKTAQEMQEQGVSVSELQTQLLQKIEELTLYIIQQEKRIKALENELKK